MVLGMKLSAMKGVCFGLTSGIITTLGMIVGLNSFSGSRSVIIGGILTIALADSLSDALGIHVSEESSQDSQKHIWVSTFATLFSKIIFSLTFIIPILVFDYPFAIIASVIWGLLLLGVTSYAIARVKKESALHIIGEHLVIALFVIILTHYVTGWIAAMF